MRIHSNRLTPDLLRRCLREHDYLPTSAGMWRLNTHGSRSRDRAFEVRIGADAGQDVLGTTRRPCMGGGYYHPFNVGDEDWTEKALTYCEWGWFLANVFAIDPDAIAGPYKGSDDFYAQTTRPGAFARAGYEVFYPSAWASELGDEWEAETE